jgi:hypothetical protein
LSDNKTDSGNSREQSLRRLIQLYKQEFGDNAATVFMQTVRVDLTNYSDIVR